MPWLSVPAEQSEASSTAAGVVGSQTHPRLFPKAGWSWSVVCSVCSHLLFPACHSTAELQIWLFLLWLPLLVCKEGYILRESRAIFRRKDILVSSTLLPTSSAVGPKPIPVCGMPCIPSACTPGGMQARDQCTYLIWEYSLYICPKKLFELVNPSARQSRAGFGANNALHQLEQLRS